MIQKPKLLSWLGCLLLLAVILYSCLKKDYSTNNTSLTPLDLTTAKQYYNRLKASEGDKVN